MLGLMDGRRVMIMFVGKGSFITDLLKSSILEFNTSSSTQEYDDPKIITNCALQDK